MSQEGGLVDGWKWNGMSDKLGKKSATYDVI